MFTHPTSDNLPFYRIPLIAFLLSLISYSFFVSYFINHQGNCGSHESTCWTHTYICESLELARHSALCFVRVDDNIYQLEKVKIYNWKVEKLDLTLGESLNMKLYVLHKITLFTNGSRKISTKQSLQDLSCYYF